MARTGSSGRNALPPKRVLLTLPRAAVHSAIVQAVSLDLTDWFVFVIRPGVATLPGPTADGGHRFYITALVDRRTFESFHVDIGLDDSTLPAAFERARQFLDPFLSGQAHGVWSPETQTWLQL